MAATPPPSSPTAATPPLAASGRALLRARAEELYRVDLPPPAGISPTFRAAGGRRLPWPVGTSAAFADVQDAHAWHRLYWLLEGVPSDVSARVGLWLRAVPDAHAAHPYATSERIRVVAEVLGTLGDALPVDMRRQLTTRFYADAAWLYDNVERELGVQNHLLNNARALCAAGHLLAGAPAADAWLRRAREIWDELWPQLLLDDGMFAEQSSHYHVLLTRTLLEYLRDARLSQRQLPPRMLEKAEQMCRITNALVRPDGSLPLFGDVAPDLPRGWLRGVPAACHRAGLLIAAPPRCAAPGYAGGASAFFRVPEAMPPAASRALGGDWKAELFPHGGLLFARHPTVGLELAAHGDPRREAACHGDTGRGSFEIWFRGRRIVVDGGMPTYEAGPTREHFRSAEGQNVVSVDGIPPTLLKDAAADLPGWYVDDAGGGTWDMESASATFWWSGFRRSRRGLVWQRSWRWSAGRITIDDVLIGAGEIDLAARIHFGELGWRAGAHRAFVTDSCRLQFDGPAELSPTLLPMLHADDYGVLANAQGVLLGARVRLPVRWQWCFDFDLGG